MSSCGQLQYSQWKLSSDNVVLSPALAMYLMERIWQWPVSHETYHLSNWPNQMTQAIRQVHSTISRCHEDVAGMAKEQFKLNTSRTRLSHLSQCLFQGWDKWLSSNPCSCSSWVQNNKTGILPKDTKKQEIKRENKRDGKCSTQPNSFSTNLSLYWLSDCHGYKEL
jgi:hypothetical protein